MKNLTEDPRYSILETDEGRAELEIYIQWISDNNLPDNQINFVDYALGRAGLQDRRHLFAIWKKLMEPFKVNLKTTLQNMSFFLNPTENSFCTSEVAGWFDFLPQVYEIMSEVPAPVIARPEYMLAGVPVKLAM